MTSPAFDRVLEHYRQRITAESMLNATPGFDEHAHRDELLLPVGETVANLIVDLVVGLNAQTLVEVGTSYGFSTLFLAEAARRTDGRLFTYELHPEKQAYAQQRISEAGLSEYVQWELGDAVKLLELQPGPVDFVLLDLWKDLYIPCFEILYPILREGGVIVADNMYVPEHVRASTAAYRAAVRAKRDMEAVVLPIGQGIDLACRMP
jgi:predicted O-methyltransferase YrrM